jgi:isopenicillin-N N-acyltransferase-like protein
MYLFNYLIFTTLFLVGTGAVKPQEKTAPFRYPENPSTQNGKLRYINNIPVLQVQGSPEQMGDAIGKYVVKNAPKATQYPRDVLSHFGVEFMWIVFAKAGQRMANFFPKDYTKELNAMATASGISKEDLIVGNTLFDLKKVVACSGVTIEPANSSTGGMLFGRNLDYPSLGYINQYTLVTVYKPENKKAFAAIGFPGLIGCLSGMNQDGLCLAIHEVIDIKTGQKKFNYNGIPYAMCYRQLLEECSTVDQAYELLNKLPRTSTTNLLIADRKRSAVFEVTPDKVIERKSKDGVAVCCNHFCCSEIKPFFPINVRRSFQRFTLLEELRTNENKVSPAQVMEYLDSVNLGDDTLQTMVFEPSTLRLHLAFQGTPSSKGPFHTLELESLFQK